MNLKNGNWKTKSRKWQLETGTGNWKTGMYIFLHVPVCRNPCRNLEVLLRLEAAAVDPDVEAEPEDRVPLRRAAVETVHHSPRREPVEILPQNLDQVVSGRPAVEEQRQAGR